MTLDAWSLLERAFGWGGVVAYHGVGNDPHSPVMHVSAARLEAQLTHLHDRHTVVPLSELVRRWRGGRSTTGCAAITFDDAYAGVAAHALPILRALDLSATVFIASNHASKRASYWWDDVERERLALKGGKWCGAPAMVGIPVCEADESSMELVRRRVLALFDGRWPGGISASADPLWRSLDVSELAALGRDDRIEFGVHTLSHPALPMLPFTEQVSEMRDNLAWLRERLPRVLPVVAYPYGLYDRTTVRAAMEAGMIAGLTMEGRATSNRPNPMIVPRIGAGDLHSPPRLALKLNRALRPALVIRNGGLHPRLPQDVGGRRHAGNRKAPIV
ncbi:MAG: polysaccharide deacetylase family protein [Gemmatimonadales bacterium]